MIKLFNKIVLILLIWLFVILGYLIYLTINIIDLDSYSLIKVILDNYQGLIFIILILLLYYLNNLYSKAENSIKAKQINNLIIFIGCLPIIILLLLGGYCAIYGFSYHNYIAYSIEGFIETIWVNIMSYKIIYIASLVYLFVGIINIFRIEKLYKSKIDTQVFEEIIETLYKKKLNDAVFLEIKEKNRKEENNEKI